MANDIRLIVVDLDGTTVGATNQISPGVSQALQAVQAKGTVLPSASTKR
jgi:hydroxymethylpyrimidine pyrophosphatase-like HAD family hydrolase